MKQGVDQGLGERMKFRFMRQFSNDNFLVFKTERVFTIMLGHAGIIMAAPKIQNKFFKLNRIYAIAPTVSLRGR